MRKSVVMRFCKKFSSYPDTYLKERKRVFSFFSDIFVGHVVF
jgi:hypothetical protein